MARTVAGMLVGTLAIVRHSEAIKTQNTVFLRGRLAVIRKFEATHADAVRATFGLRGGAGAGDCSWYSPTRPG